MDVINAAALESKFTIVTRNTKYIFSVFKINLIYFQVTQTCDGTLAD